MESKIFAIAVLLCSSAALSAQDVPSRQPVPAPIGVINDVDVLHTNVTLENLDNPPKREIRFERAKEPVKERLMRPDPKLFEQKYMAIVRLELPQNYNGAIYLAEMDAESALLFWGDQYFLNPNLFRSGLQAVHRGENVKRMLKFIPEDRRPGAEEIDFFISDDRGLFYPHQEAHDGGFFGGSGDGGRSRVNRREFRILAATPEQAEQRAAALLTIFDLGFSRPIQMAILKKRSPLEEELRANRKLLAAEEAQVTDLRRALDSFADFTPEMLPGLRVQQLQLEVDLAGVKARIAACERLLSQAGNKSERQQQLEDAKIAAEIELSGFEARRAKSEEFVGKVKKKIDLTGAYHVELAERNAASKKCKSLETQIRVLDREIQIHGPLPLVEGKVIIAPLEWTQ